MAFGSTIVSTYPDGRQAELWLKRDGTYDRLWKKYFADVEGSLLKP